MKPSVYKGKFDVASARRSFAQKFGRQYGLKLLELQKWHDRNMGNLGLATFIFGERMSMEEFHIVCQKVAEWMGGELYGTVNIDFFGSVPSVDIMVEYDNGGSLCKDCTGSIRGRGPVV